MPTNVFSGGFVVPAMMGGCAGGRADGMRGGISLGMLKDKIKEKWDSYQPMVKYSIGVIIVVAIIIVVVLAATGQFKHKSNQSRFASSGESLLDKMYADGWRVHTRSGCGWCDKQKKDCPDLKHHPIHIDCGRPENAASCAPIQGFPHWQNIKTGENMPGYKSLDQLEMMLSTTL